MQNLKHHCDACEHNKKDIDNMKADEIQEESVEFNNGLQCDFYH